MSDKGQLIELFAKKEPEASPGPAFDRSLSILWSLSGNRMSLEIDNTMGKLNYREVMDVLQTALDVLHEKIVDPTTLEIPTDGFDDNIQKMVGFMRDMGYCTDASGDGWNHSYMGRPYVRMRVRPSQMLVMSQRLYKILLAIGVDAGVDALVHVEFNPADGRFAKLYIVGMDDDDLTKAALPHVQEPS